MCRRAKALSQARVYPIGALTVKLRGERLTEMSELSAAGCVAFSQANAPFTDTQVLWRALQYAATFGYRVWLRVEDPWLAKGGVAATAMTGWGSGRGRGFVRFVFSNEPVDRLRGLRAQIGRAHV